ncbi:MAG: site-2 protease family protein, partial [Planctomycetota bacterium]
MRTAESHPPSELEILLVRRRPRARLQGLLYLLTCLTTFAAGAVGWQPLLLGVDDAGIAAAVTNHWDRGLLYMAAVMAVLTAHEAGHFIAAKVHGIPATLPFFIPMPILLTGTLGAVIGMEGSRANRRQLFDIAVAGPLAGLVVAVPLLALGLLGGTADGSNPFALAPFAVWLQSFVRPDLAPGTTVAPN